MMIMIIFQYSNEYLKTEENEMTIKQLQWLKAEMFFIGFILGNLTMYILIN